jgi:hypothetical protein
VDSSPEGDPDGDGISNYSEYLINADPMNRSSLLDVNMTFTQTNVSLSFTQPANLAIIIDNATNIINPNWGFLKSRDNLIAFPSQPVSRTVVDFLESPQKFYRLRIMEP